ncbi:hypothetical protein F2Q69_00006480 [Brassica cretica]|uniref:Uncharacterized protein n=1 Tax=Brassica cretica TaxID=69181 RepID=A0A8S9PGG6_BRACR|nr:hypothetical protein F2Q69_00006480 [Brassica cretica]
MGLLLIPRRVALTDAGPFDLWTEIETNICPLALLFYWETERFFRGCKPRNVENRISLDEVSIVSEDRLNRGHLAPGRGRPAPRSPRPWARRTRTEVTSPMGEDDRRRGHLAHGRGRPAPRTPFPWARTTRAEVTSPMGEDDPHRGHLPHGCGSTSSPETVHPRLSSRNTIFGPLDAIPMSRLA